MLAGAAAVLLWALFSLTAGIRIVAGDGRLIAREMLRAAPAGTTGLPESEYAGVGGMIAEYLTGRRADLQYEYLSREGTPVRCFGDREQRHMADVRGLIRLDGAVMGLSLAAAGILAFAGIRSGMRRKQAAPEGAIRESGNGIRKQVDPEGAIREGGDGIRRQAAPEEWIRGIRIGGWALAALTSGMILWAAADFDGFFITFHHLAFSNDLWLLDPRKEMLIRLMPTAFFVRMAAKAGGWALGIGLAPAAAGLLRRRRPAGRRREKETRDSKGP